jgi:hypothetical protein
VWELCEAMTRASKIPEAATFIFYVFFLQGLVHLLNTDFNKGKI